MIASCQLHQLPHESVLHFARQEVQQFLRHEPTDGSPYSWELFRRALVLRDEGAWVGIYELYHNMVWSWLLRSQFRHPSLSVDDLPDLVNEIFAKFARSISPERFTDFVAVPALLAYLKCCARSVLMDADRKAQHREVNEEPLETAFFDEPLGMDDPVYEIAERECAEQLWHLLLSEMQTPDEHLVLYALCMTDVPPRELQRRYPQVFARVEDVYRVKRNVVERLRRSQTIRAWRAREEAIA